MESKILQTLDYNLQVTTFFDYLNLFMMDFDRFCNSVAKQEFKEGEFYFKDINDEAQSN